MAEPNRISVEGPIEFLCSNILKTYVIVMLMLRWKGKGRPWTWTHLCMHDECITHWKDM